MNLHTIRSFSGRLCKRSLSVTLALLLVMTPLSGLTSAAEDKVLSSIEFDTSSSSLSVLVEEDRLELGVLAAFEGSTSKVNVTSSAAWKSSDASIVKVDKGIISGLARGTAVISATYKTKTISMNVSSDYIYDTVTLLRNGTAAPDSLDLEMNESIAFTAEGKKGNGSAVTITSEAVWSTSNAAIAKVDQGTLTLTGVGTATITVKYKGKSDTVKLNVTSPYKSLSIEPDDVLELEVEGDSKELAATVQPKSGGSPLDATDSAVWSSSNAGIATVEKGIVTPVAAGKAMITATRYGVSDSVEVVVRPAYQAMKFTPSQDIHMLLQGGTKTIQVSVIDDKDEVDFVSNDATWTSSNIMAATVAGGVITPKAPGTSKITASYKGVSRSLNVTVYPSIKDMDVEKDELDGFVGASESLPKLIAQSISDEELDVSKLAVWTTSDDDIIEVKDGKWTALKIGEAVLTGKVQSQTVTVTVQVHAKPLVLQTEASSLSVVLNKEVPLPAVTIIYENGDEAIVTDKVTWKASSANLLVKPTTMRGLVASTVTLTATYLNKSTSIRVTIEEEIVKLVAEPEAIALNPGRSKSVRVTGYYKSGKKVSIGSKMGWEVTPAALASVKGSSVKALIEGTGKLVGTYQGKTISIPITVTAKLKSLTLSDKSLKLAAGQKYSLKLAASYDNGKTLDVTAASAWTSSNTKIATVADGQIAAVSKGSTSIKATYNGKSVTLRVTVS